MPSIIIQDIAPRIQYVASPVSQAVFTYPFPIFAPTDILVFEYVPGTAPNDQTQQLVYNVDYTVAEVGNPNGGYITLTVPAPAGNIITLVRLMPDQRLNYYINTAITADMLNTDFESDVMMIQQNTMYNQDITPHYNLDAQILPFIDTILPLLPANSVWIKNANNTAITTATLPAFPVGTSVDGTGTFQHITRWAGPQLLEDSSVILDDSGNITNANSIVAGHVYVSGQTVTTNTGDLILNSFTGSVDVTSILNLNLRTPLRWYDTTNSNYVAFQAPSTLSGNTTWNLPAQDGSTGYALITDGAGNLSFGPVSEPTTTGVAVPIAQTAHGFTVGQIVIFNGTNYVLAQADNSVDCEVIGIVSEVIDANNFQLLTEGFVSGLSGLTSGDTYFLSDVTPGLLTLTEPVTAMHISKPLFIAQSATTGYFHNWRGKIIPVGGSSNLVFSGNSIISTNTNGPIDLVPNGTGQVFSASNFNIQTDNSLQLYNTANTFYSGLKASSTLASSTTWTLPLADGTIGQVLGTNGSGALSFSTPTIDQTIYPDFSLVTQAAVPAGSPGTIKYESTTIYTSIVNNKKYAIGVGFIGSPTLTIWDITNQTSPILTGTFVAAGGGAYNCTVGVVSGVQYAFIGYNSGSHFVVVNLTNPALPVQVSNTVITGGAGSIYDVSFLNGYVYCGTQNAGLVVMDVGGGSGTPAVPVQTFTQGATKSFGVVATGTNVYTTQFSTSSPFTIRQIISWTITGLGTPSIPSLVQSLQVTTAGEALGLSVSGNTAFVTVAAAGVNVIDLIDITTPSAMTNLSQISSSNGFNSAFFAVANGNYLYIPSGANATYGGAIDAYDITVRTAPIHIAQVTTGNPTSVFGAIALSGGYIFCADYGIVASNNGYFDVFTQINANAVVGNIVGSTAYFESLTPSTALVSSASDEIISSITTATELSYVHGVTSSIQAQINALVSGGLTWNVVTSSQAMVANNGYFVNSASPVTLTLPSTISVGSTFQVVNMNTGGFTIAQNAGQQIRFGTSTTTSGAGGSISSANEGDAIGFVCNVANTNLIVTPGSIGDLTVV